MAASAPVHVFIFRCFLICFQLNILTYDSILTLSQMTNFRPLKAEESAGHNFNFDENGRKFSKWVENTVGISPFPIVFS